MKKAVLYISVFCVAIFFAGCAHQDDYHNPDRKIIIRDSAEGRKEGNSRRHHYEIDDEYDVTD
ncbi:MAG: hypothetical protein GY795_11130 [Desulfobacterales bacterium]|nr:hypothetical protein [Desulfobacterales bacterium]